MTDTSKLGRKTDMKDIDMWLLMLEAGIALFLLVFIVWWTMPSKKKQDQARSGKTLPNDDAKP